MLSNEPGVKTKDSRPGSDIPAHGY